MTAGPGPRLSPLGHMHGRRLLMASEEGDREQQQSSLQGHQQQPPQEQPGEPSQLHHPARQADHFMQYGAAHQYKQSHPHPEQIAAMLQQQRQRGHPFSQPELRPQDHVSAAAADPPIGQQYPLAPGAMQSAAGPPIGAEPGPFPHQPYGRLRTQAPAQATHHTLRHMQLEHPQSSHPFDGSPPKPHAFHAPSHNRSSHSVHGSMQGPRQYHSHNPLSPKLDPMQSSSNLSTFSSLGHEGSAAPLDSTRYSTSLSSFGSTGYSSGYGRHQGVPGGGHLSGIMSTGQSLMSTGQSMSGMMSTSGGLMSTGQSSGTWSEHEGRDPAGFSQAPGVSGASLLDRVHLPPLIESCGPPSGVVATGACKLSLRIRRAFAACDPPSGWIKTVNCLLLLPQYARPA